MTSMPGSRFPGAAARAVAIWASPARTVPIRAAVMAWVPHSARAMTRTFTNAPVPFLPLLRPQRSVLAGLSGASSSTPSMLISRRPHSHAPAVDSCAHGSATRSNSSRSGSLPAARGPARGPTPSAPAILFSRSRDG
jgi:hypothetical protein